MEQLQRKVGDRHECPNCHAVYELSFEGKSIQEKDHARCRFCRAVMIDFPIPFALKVVNWPRMWSPA
jgi:hypothetical protein